jgi:hypothetical protein
LLQDGGFIYCGHCVDTGNGDIGQVGKSLWFSLKVTKQEGSDNMKVGVVVDGHIIAAKILAKEEELDEHSILHLGEGNFVICIKFGFVIWAVDIQDWDYGLPKSALSEGVFELEFQQQAADSSEDGHGKA